ncbi:FtsK Spo IIIE protein [Saccharomonospora phage PIS 136]|nr:FtsK Spo IIIE protein [Saccharomonospora phage PIS 136]
MTPPKNPKKKPDTPPTPEMPAELCDWQADRRWYHPVLASLGIYSAGFLPQWMDWDSTVMIPTGLAATVAAMIGVKIGVDEDELGAKHEKQAMALTGVAGAAATGWLVHADGAPYTPSSLGLLALWTLTFGAGYAVLRSKEPERFLAKKAENDNLEQRAENAKELRQVMTYQQIWHPWFKAKKLPIEIVNVTTTEAGYTLRVVPKEDANDVPEFGALMAATEGLAVKASLYYAKQGREIGVNDIRFEPTDMAHVWNLHVSTLKPLKENRPHPGVRPPTTMYEPVEVGVYEDMTPLKFDALGQHGIMIGATESGKSTFTHNYLDNLLSKPDCLVWVAGVQKLMPLIGSWLYPWLTGQTNRPVIDRIGGEDPEEVLYLLDDFLNLATALSKELILEDKRKVSPENPAICLILDEASALAENKDVRINTFDGRENITASQLINDICRVARAAGMSVFFLTQFGLVDALGDYGTKTMRNVNVRIVGRTNSDHDGAATLNSIRGVRSTELRYNTLMAQTSREVPRAVPAKAFKLNEANEIVPLAHAYTDRRPVMPAKLVQLLGDSYTGRWNPDRNPDLVAACAQLGVPYPHVSPEVSGIAHASPQRSGGDSGLVDATPRETLAETVPSPRQEKPVTPRPATTKGNPLSSTLSNLQDTVEKMRARNAFQRDHLENLATMVASTRAPEWFSAALLAEVAGVAGENPTDEAVADAAERTIEFFTGAPFDCPPVERNNVLGWDRETLLDAIRTVILDARGSGDAGLPEEQQKVIDAVADLDDSEWVQVSQLGRDAGLVPTVPESASEEEKRKAQHVAGQFGKGLRKSPWDLPETAFKKLSHGNVVNVGALRQAVKAQREAAGV